mgnify:CR=1 FL=1
MIDISNNSKNQQTIAEPVSISGIGLHSGIDVSMKLYPAKADYGIKSLAGGIEGPEDLVSDRHLYSCRN